MWVNAQRDGRPAEYRCRPLRKFRNSIPCTTPQTLADARCWTAVQYRRDRCQYRRTQDLDVYSEYCTGQNSVRGKSFRKCIYSVPAHETAKHLAKFGWPPVSDVAAVTKARSETSSNLLGCPKLQNRSQPLVGRSSPYIVRTWRRYCRLTSFFPIVDACLRCEDTARQNIVQCAQMANFWRFLRPVFSANRVQQISNLHSKFALRPHHVWQYG